MQSPERRGAVQGQGIAASPSTSPSALSSHSPAAAAAPSNPKKSRSCAVCRSRKVRCDKLSPCTNCRRAGIACVVPQPDRLPRWARRLDRAALSRDAAGDSSQPPQSTLLPPPTPQVLERLRNLEALVRELNSQLQQAQTGNTSSSAGQSPPSAGPATSPDASTRTSEPRGEAGLGHVQGSLGRLAINDSHSSRYVSSSFWIRIKDEIDGLEGEARDQGMNDLESSDDGDDQGESGFGGSMPASERRSTGGTLELDRTPAERHAFMFRHNLSAAQPRLEDFRPLPSQVPFLINVFHENVNSFVQVVHIPTVHKMTRDIRKQGGTSSLSPSDEALLFSIYYVAVTSMEDEDVIANFGTTKNDLNLKFRLGFEHAMARADFLNSPNLTLVQALATFLFLVRRYDSPRYVWMMVGVAIRMAQSLGLHRDGASFPGLSPFEIEIRRRVWWALYILDLRSSEDQGTSMTITEGNFDTKRPLSINDNDISPQTTELPPEREGYTDMTMPGIYIDTAAAAAKLLSVEIHDGIPDIEHHGRLVIESYAVLERCGAQISNAQYRMAMVIASLVVAKTTLILYLPVVAAAGSPGTTRTEDISRKLLVSAIEVAEFNHELSADLAFRNWHWLCQTYSHWYAIVYILTRISARPWSPTSERAWTALRSPWLIPKYPEHVKRNNQVIVPLRRLMAKSKAHRASELRRLRSDPVAAQAVEEDDKKNPTARSHGIDVILEGSDDDVQAYHLEKWRQLLMHGGSDAPAQLSSSSSASPRAMSNIAPAYASGGAGMSGTEASYSTMSLGSFDTSPSNTGSGVSNTMAPGTLHQASTSFHPDPVAFVSARNLQQQQASWNSEYRAPTTTDDNSEAPPPASGIGTGAVLESWLWADADLGGTLPPSSGQSYHNGQGGDWADTTMNNFDAEMNWLDLIESAKDMEWEALPQMGGMW